MKRIIILLLLLSSYALQAQRVLKHTLIPKGKGGSDVSICKITDYRLMVNNLLYQRINTTLIGADGDTIRSFPRKYGWENIARVNNQGVSIEFSFLNASGRLDGLTMDSNGILIDSFTHYYGDINLSYSTKLLDSYTDSNGNVVLHTYSLVNWGRPGSYTIVIHFTLNQFGQLLKYKEYGPTGLIGGLSKGSKLLVKDGKLWGFTAITQDGVIGIGIDTAGFTGQSYYLCRANMTSSAGYSVLPFKKNGYYTVANTGTYSITAKSEVTGIPVTLDSMVNSNRYVDVWVNHDSSKINIYWPISSAPSTIRKISYTGQIEKSITIREDTFYNTVGFFCFGDGSWINIGQNPRTLQFPGYPYMLTRISDMGYPYDPWKQQVVFKGVTGTAKDQERPTVLAYPNPTQDRLKFLGMAEGSVRLIDATGKELLSQTLTEEGISLAHLPKGLYRYLVTYRGKYYQGSVVRE